MNMSDLHAVKLIKDSKSTPFYVYDLKTVKENYSNLYDAFAGHCKILYSLKCNPHPQVVRWFSGQSSSMVDVSSLQELKLALQNDFTPERISFVGPGKSIEEIDFCLKNNVGFLVIESLSELKTVLSKSLNNNFKTRLVIRVALKQIVNVSGKKKESFATQFGLSEDDLKLALKIIRTTLNTNLQFAGLHCFVQSQQLRAENIIQNFKYAFELFERTQLEYGEKLSVLNLGGGLGVPYFHEQEPIDLMDLRAKWLALYADFKTRSGNEVLLLVESGRFLMASAGAFYTQVLYRKKTYEKNYVICDGGLTQNLMVTGFGQSIRRNFKIVKVTDTPLSNLEKYVIAGPSCYAMDTLALDVLMPELNEGDLLRVENCGAYGPTFSPQDFLSRPHAQEYILNENS